MIRLLSIAVLLAASGLALAPAARPGVEATQACPANPSPPDAADPSMILNEPWWGTR